MSIQSRIDYHLSKEGGNQYNIVITGESGSMKLPRGVNVSLYDCNIKDIDAKQGDNAIFIGGGSSKVLGTIDQHDGSFSAENTKFFGEVFWRKSTRVKLVKDSVFYFRVNVEENTYADIFNCDWDGFGSYALRAIEHSRIVASKCTLRKREKGAWALKGSFIDLNNCTVATVIGLKAEENAQINMVGGQLKPTQIGAQADIKCQIYLSKLDEPVKGSDFNIRIEDWSKLVAHGTSFQDANIAIQAKKFCTVEVMDFDFIKSQGSEALKFEDHTTGRFVFGSLIESAGSTAIYGKDHCSISCIDVTTINGKGKHGVEIKDNNSKFEATGKGIGVIKGVKAGIKATQKSSVGVDHYQLIKGDAEDGIVLEDDSKAHLSLVQQLISSGANGAKLSNESDISFQDQQTIKGTGANGILADNNCTVNLQTVNQCIGEAGAGIKISNSTNLAIIYTELIDGKAGFGIEGSLNCDISINRSTKITGVTGGVKNVTEGSLNIEQVRSIAPESGVGVLTESDVDTRLFLVKEVKWGTKHKNCFVVIKDCPNIINQAGIAITVEGGEVNIQNTVATGIDKSMQLTGTFAKASGTELNQSIQCTNSEIEFNGVTLNGSITSSGDTISLNRGGVGGSISCLNSTLNLQLVTVTNSLTMNGGTLDMEKSSVNTSMSLSNAVMKGRLASAQSCTMTASTADLNGGSLGDITIDGSTSIIMLKCGSSVQGAGNVIALGSGSVGLGMNRIVMGGTQISIINSLEALFTENAANILLDTTTSGGTVITNGV